MMKKKIKRTIVALLLSITILSSLSVAAESFYGSWCIHSGFCNLYWDYRVWVHKGHCEYNSCSGRMVEGSYDSGILVGTDVRVTDHMGNPFATCYTTSRFYK